IYALAYYKILGTPAQQLLIAAGISVAMGVAYLPIGRIRILVERGHSYAVLGIFWGLFAAWSVSTVLLWEYAAPIAIIMAWVAFLVALAAGVRGRWLLGVGAASLALSAGLLWLNAHPFGERLTTANNAGLAALVLLASTVLLFILGSIIVRLFRYRSVQGRLVTAMTLIMAVPVLFTTGVAAITAYSNSQAQFRDSLQAVSTLRRVQIDTIVQPIGAELSGLQSGGGRARSILNTLYPGAGSLEAYAQNKQAAATLLWNQITQYPNTNYEELLVLNISGSAIVTTAGTDEGTNFSSQDYFINGRQKFYATMTRFTGASNPNGQFKLVVAVPFYGANQEVRGVVVAVVKSDRILAQVGPAAGLTDVKTYLVNNRDQLVTRGAGSSINITALPIAQLLVAKSGQGSGTYTNYSEQSALGSFEWDSTINSAVVSEVPNADVYSRALASLLISGLVGLFAIAIAAIAALSTAQAISEPIHSLAAVATKLSTGDLGARANIEQPDEVGNLADSFNTMATQLQGIIGNLEQRVSERTEALAQQSNRLRAAAEVARDAASAASLDELLDRAAHLIMERFGFYHAGIFLVDEKGEFAVLRASPSEAGRKMLENQHRLRVGEQGIVGRVAATGEPRIALDTGVDPVHFRNPLLPNTHSEMALPLKTAEGTIGVIDIQSDQPEAFTQEDIAIVQVMADQLATAIQRTNLLQQVQAQLQQLEQSYQSFTEQSWRTFGKVVRHNVGYKFDNVRLESIKSVPDELRPALEAGGKTREDESGQTLQVPIRLRGQVIGVVQLRFQGTHHQVATTEMIQQIADRLATALENARLLEDSLRRANKERAIGEITAKISSSMNMRNVLQTAVEELGRAIPGSEVMIQFRPDTEV
ncbi:MAG: GAF domain-containing protein, partial [Anaerolineae bacterium]